MILVGSGKKGVSLVELLRKVFVIAALGTKATVVCELDAPTAEVVLLGPEGEELATIEVALPVPGSGTERGVELARVALSAEVVGSRFKGTSRRRAGRSMRARGTTHVGSAPDCRRTVRPKPKQGRASISLRKIWPPNSTTFWPSSMIPTAILRSGRSAWKGTSFVGDLVRTTDVLLGPYFVAFPNLKEALTSNIPIKTDARSCTILPNFVG